MREIRFRGKEKGTEEWVYGCAVQDYKLRWGIMSDCFYFAEVNPESIGQCTGLTDANGIEIYEGDILESKNNTKHQVIYNSSLAAFMARGVGNWAYCSLDKDWILKFERKIIGNTYDNPELLSKTL
jgi:uncharacterized phage protein (TIGR01671 family)